MNCEVRGQLLPALGTKMTREKFPDESYDRQRELSWMIRGENSDFVNGIRC